MKLLSIVKLSVLSTALILSGASFASNGITLALKDSTTNTQAAPSDASITAHIKEKFIKEKLFDDVNISALTIHVETSKGIVHLTGTAKSKQQVDNAIKISTSVEGVTKVVSDIKVKDNK